MPIFASQLWFQPESEERPNPNELHAFMEDKSVSLCGDEVRIRHNRDEIFASPPEGSTTHEACRLAVEKLNRQ